MESKRARGLSETAGFPQHLTSPWAPSLWIIQTPLQTRTPTLPSWPGTSAGVSGTQRRKAGCLRPQMGCGGFHGNAHPPAEAPLLALAQGQPAGPAGSRAHPTSNRPPSSWAFAHSVPTSFLLPATLSVPEDLGQSEWKPSSKQGPRSLGTPTSSLYRSVVMENETHRQIFQSRTPPPSLGNGRPSGGPNPSTDPACYPPLGDQWRAIWPSLLPSAGNREGRLSIRTLSLLVSTSFFPLTTSGEARRWGG